MYQLSQPTFQILAIAKRQVSISWQALRRVGADFALCRLNRVLVLGLVGLGLAACEQEVPEIVEQVRAIKVITVTDPASGQTRKFSGIVQATDSSALSFQVGGNVQQVEVALGDHVEQGQLLAVLDKKPYELNLEAARSELQKAKAQHEEKRQEYRRQKTLFDKEWVSQAALDQAQAAFDSAKSQVNFATSKVNLAQRDLNNTVLTAPFAGTIAEKSVDPFVEVSAGQKLFEINADGAIEVALNIPETVISQLTIGMPVSVSLPTQANCDCKGRITEIGSAAGDANAFPVKAGLLDPPLVIRPGMSAEVTLVLSSETQQQAFLVPLSSISPGAERQRGYVFVFDPETSTVKQTPIRAGPGSENLVAITDGVKAGDVIAVAGVSFLSDGQKVKLMQP